MNIKNCLLDYVEYEQLYWYSHVRRINEEMLPSNSWIDVRLEEEREGLEIRSHGLLPRQGYTLPN